MSDDTIRVFVSCRMEDGPSVELFVKCLRCDDIQVSWAGDAGLFTADCVIAESVFGAISDCDIVLIFGTVSSLRSQWIWDVERPTAQLLGKPTPLLDLGELSDDPVATRRIGGGRLAIVEPDMFRVLREIRKAGDLSEADDALKDFIRPIRQELRLLRNGALEEASLSTEEVREAGSKLVAYLEEMADKKNGSEQRPVDGWSLESIDSYIDKVRALVAGAAAQTSVDSVGRLSGTSESCRFSLADRPDRTGFVASLICASRSSSYAQDGPNGSWLVLADATQIKVVSTVDAIVRRRPPVFVSIDASSIAPNHTIVGLDQALERGDFLDLVVDLEDGGSKLSSATVSVSLVSRAFSATLRPAPGTRGNGQQAALAHVDLDRVLGHRTGTDLPSEVEFNGLSATVESAGSR